MCTSVSIPLALSSNYPAWCILKIELQMQMLFYLIEEDLQWLHNEYNQDYEGIVRGRTTDAVKVIATFLQQTYEVHQFRR